MMKWCEILAVFLLMVAVTTEVKLVHIADAQTICNMSGQELMSCRPAVTPPNPSAPSPVCCNALKHADIPCFCSYKNSNWLSPFGIDPNLALQLPEKCNFPRPANC